jgi:hypothetical protein
VKVIPVGGTRPYEFSLNGNPYQTNSAFTELSAGTYLITVRDSNGCIFTDSVTIEELTGVFEMENDIRCIVYPNPASDVIIISAIGNSSNADGFSLNLYDTYGRLILHQNSSPDEISRKIILDIHAMEKGVFFLSIKTSGGGEVWVKVLKY